MPSPLAPSSVADSRLGEETAPHRVRGRRRCQQAQGRSEFKHWILILFAAFPALWLASKAFHLKKPLTTYIEVKHRSAAILT
jgi:hypothetical protein